MAKNKGKRSSDVKAASPDGGVPLNESNSGADSLPNLDQSAFAGLRQKIEQELKNENEAKQKPKNKAKDTSNDAPKKTNDTPKKEKAAPAKPESKEESNKNKGKKRDRNGDVIAREQKNAGKSKPSSSGQKNDHDTLRQEILALGGTQDDYDLLADIDSESEVEGAADTSKKSNKKSDDDSLRKELSSMLAAAGQVVPEDLNGAEDNAADEDEDEDEEPEIGEDSEDEEGLEQEISDIEEETPPAPSPKAAKEQSKNAITKEPAKVEPETILPKAYSNLVCIPTDHKATLI